MSAVSTGELVWATRPQQGRFRDPAPSVLEYPEGSMVVIGGPVGVGKSTLLARLTAADPALTVVSLDELRRDEQQLRGLPRMEYHPRCWTAALAQFDRLMRSYLRAGRSVLCDLTAVHSGPIFALADLAHEFGRPAHVIYLDGTLRICLDGQAGRVAPIDEPTVRDYVRAWESTREQMAEEGLELLGWDSAVVLDRAAADQLQRVRFF